MSIASDYFSSSFSVEVKESSIEGAGLGLFALKDWKRNQIICPYEGKRISRDSMNADENASYPGGDYVLEYKKDHFMDCGESLTCCPGRYINDARDSKRYNCRFIYKKSDDTVWIESTKHIHAGDELFIYYGEQEYWKRKK